eukprot:TRINITY_DN19236_c0_g1_i2.p1 TRINITY_DN19236_c0_g1~~TRINITY_DN19236_c0_g1_i2.p1  ORF type:complete len:444 (+),score=104.92 TRINITY_DN19236_c0_g1_i2:112-1443(+)
MLSRRRAGCWHGCLCFGFILAAVAVAGSQLADFVSGWRQHRGPPAARCGVACAAAAYRDASTALRTLGFDPEALKDAPSDDDIKKAYRRAALKSHPDSNGGSTEQFQAVKDAYEFLSGDDAWKLRMLVGTTAGRGGAAWPPPNAKMPRYADYLYGDLYGIDEDDGRRPRRPERREDSSSMMVMSLIQFAPLLLVIFSLLLFVPGGMVRTTGELRYAQSPDMSETDRYAQSLATIGRRRVIAVDEQPQQQLQQQPLAVAKGGEYLASAALVKQLGIPLQLIGDKVEEGATSQSAEERAAKVAHEIEARLQQRSATGTPKFASITAVVPTAEFGEVLSALRKTVGEGGFDEPRWPYMIFSGRTVARFERLDAGEGQGSPQELLLLPARDIKLYDTVTFDGTTYEKTMSAYHSPNLVVFDLAATQWKELMGTVGGNPGAYAQPDSS